MFNSFYSQTVDESLVKALFIKKIVPYVDWGENTNTKDFRIAFLGKSHLESYVKELFRKDENYNGNVQFIQISESDLKKPYHILIVSYHYKKHIKAVHPKTLSILDNDSFFGKNIIIRFLKVDDRIRFKISTGALKLSDITLSSRLLKLALNDNSEDE